MRRAAGNDKTIRVSPTAPSALRREVGGILLLALSLFLALSLGSLQFSGGRLMGPGGAMVALGFYALIGVGSWVAATALGVASVRLLAGRPMRLGSWEVVGYLSATLFAALLMHLATGTHRLHGYSTGGLLGEYGAELMVALLGTAGTVLIGVTGLLLSLVATTPLTASGIGRAFARTARGTWTLVSRLSLVAFPQRSNDASDHDSDNDNGRDRAPARLADPAATRPMLAAPIVKAPKISRPAQKPEAAAAKESEAAPALLAMGDTRRTRVVPPPGEDDTPLVTSAAALEIKGRRKKGNDGDTDVATQQGDAATQQGNAAKHNTQKMIVSAAATAAAGEAAAATTVTAGPIVPIAEKLAVPAGDKPPEKQSEKPGDKSLVPAPVINVPRRGRPDPTLAEATRETTSSDAPEAIDEASDRTDVSAAPPSMHDPVAAPTISAPSAGKPTAGPLDYIRIGSGEYRLPGIALLDYDEAAHAEIDRQSMLDLAVRLEKTLLDYGVKGRVSEIHPGPVVTMYEFVPQAGTKLSKITALSNDLAMALEALKVRIVAPIPGKAAVGIEVPNRVRETVYFKEIIASEAFARTAHSKLAMALGKDIVGNPVVVDLAKMPHLLIAGTTGSGKSVSVNAMICSLLFGASPEEVKMIMIDPKMLELSIYEGIPHLLLPVVTDPKKANLALRWAVEEMERRYDLISKSGVRDIANYNKKVEKRLADRPAEIARAAEEPKTATVKIWVGEVGNKREVEVDANAQAVAAAGGVVDSAILDEISAACAAAHSAAMQQMELAAIAPEKKLPYIVIVIDEFADLMMVASKEVEQSVARIAQKARAAGIHLMLATQRPSVDVITGLIKANFPSRIAFQVASKIDARTILDQQGAESLLGMGDMLFSDRGLALKRVHGPLVSDVEIHRVVDFLKSQGKPVYDLDILKPRAEEGEDGGGEEDWSDEMYDQAVAMVSEMTQASTSMLQRRMRLGYNRAARMIERMEREGIVGPADGARPRDVLVHSHAA